MQRLRELGDLVHRRWERFGRDTAAFPHIATEALRDSPVFSEVGVEEIAKMLFGAEALPPQKLRDFGQPPINVYRTDDFLIELLFWMDSPTSIHQHAFSGAFAVLHGCSYHSEYSFTMEERISRDLALGDLHFDKAEYLTKGCVRTIEPGDSFIHALLHLQAPSVSIVVRTIHEPEYEPQFSYLAPGFAFTPRLRSEPLDTQVAFLKTIYKTDRKLVLELAAELIESGDLWAAHRAFEVFFEREPVSNAVAQLLERLRARHRNFAETYAEGLRTRQRRAFAQKVMQQVTDPDLRFFLAMLINAPNAEVILNLICARFPDAEPRAKIGEWFDAVVRSQGLLPGCAAPSVLLETAMNGGSFEDAARTCGFSAAEDLRLLRKDWYTLHCMEWIQPLLTGVPALTA